MGYLGATLTQVFTRTRWRSRRVTQRCHNSPRWETGLASANDVMHRKRTEDLGNFKKVELRTGHRTRRVDFRLLAEALSRCRTRWWGGGGRWKSQNRKNVYLSPYVKEPLNSKVIKSFVPELRSCKCFSNFEIPMFYLYGHSIYVSHIAISWLWSIWYDTAWDWTLVSQTIGEHYSLGQWPLWYLKVNGPI